MPMLFVYTVIVAFDGPVVVTSHDVPTQKLQHGTVVTFSAPSHT